VSHPEQLRYLAESSQKLCLRRTRLAELANSRTGSRLWQAGGQSHVNPSVKSVGVNRDRIRFLDAQFLQKIQRPEHLGGNFYTLPFLTFYARYQTRQLRFQRQNSIKLIAPCCPYMKQQLLAAFKRRLSFFLAGLYLAYTTLLLMGVSARVAKLSRYEGDVLCPRRGVKSQSRGSDEQNGRMRGAG
jgi:hypothetical protein